MTPKMKIGWDQLCEEHHDLQAAHKVLHSRPEDHDAHNDHMERLHAHTARVHDFAKRLHDEHEMRFPGMSEGPEPE